MSEPTGTWSELFRENPLPVVVFAGGVGLHSIEVFIVATLLPSVVRDIGGLDYFAWNTTLFIVASIFASVFAAVRPFGMNARGTYLLAATVFGLGSLVAGFAPNIWTLLAGRTLQGFGTGLLVALTFAMVRIVFPERLWPRAMALVSAVWGVSTLLGPAIGGIFAQLDAWRWAFFVIVPAAVLLALGALRVLPRGANPESMKHLPLLQIMLVITAVIALSVASVVTDTPWLAGGLLLASVASIVGLGVVERHARQRVLPTGTFTLGSALGPLFATMLLLQMAVVSDAFAPLFLQRLHGLGPLAAGYVVALVSAGWSISSIVASGWRGTRASLTIVAGPVLMLAGGLGLAMFLATANPAGSLDLLVPTGIALFVVGLGIGSAIQKLTERVLTTSPISENNLTSAALSMVQLFASGLGVAAGGLIVNATGLPGATSAAEAAVSAQWLYWLFALVPALAVPLAIVAARSSHPPEDDYEPIEVAAE